MVEGRMERVYVCVFEKDTEHECVSVCVVCVWSV